MIGKLTKRLQEGGLRQYYSNICLCRIGQLQSAVREGRCTLYFIDLVARVAGSKNPHKRCAEE